MLPLVSSTIPRLTGTRSVSNFVIRYLAVLGDPEMLRTEPRDELTARVADRQH
jgi:hypothetical protein